MPVAGYFLYLIICRLYPTNGITLQIPLTAPRISH